MEIVIKIPDKLYNNIIDIPESSMFSIDCDSRIRKAIQNGTPLPEEHRGIVDLKEVQWAFDDAILEEAKKTGKVRASHNEIAKVLQTIPIIIKENKEV